MPPWTRQDGCQLADQQQNGVPPGLQDLLEEGGPLQTASRAPSEIRRSNFDSEPQRIPSFRCNRQLAAVE